MQWEPKPDSPAALDDEAEHSAFLQKVALDLAGQSPPPALRAPAPKAQHVRKADLDRALSRLSVTIGRAVRELVVAPLEKKIAELESRPVFDYTGTFKQGRTYRKGQGCTHDGSIFVALKDYPTTPGTPNSGWQLAVKRGRDGKNVK